MMSLSLRKVGRQEYLESIVKISVICFQIIQQHTETPANKDVTSDITGTHTMANCVVLLD